VPNTLALVLTLSLILPLVGVARMSLPLTKPQYEWKACSCNGPLVIGLTQNDFIVHQMYMQGLIHEYERCNRPREDQ